MREKLPLFLAQDYPDYEVIVADEAADDGTACLLKEMEKDFFNLRYLSLPGGCIHAARRKMSLTLGIRAARHEWIVVTGADCVPAGRQWLRCLAAAMTEDNEVVIGCATYADPVRTAYPRAAYRRLRRQIHWLRSLASGRAVFADSANFAFRRSWFERHDGYASTLSLHDRDVENTVLVDRYSRKETTGMACCRESLMLQDYPGRQAAHALQRRQNEIVCRLSLRARLLNFSYRLGIFFGTLFPVSFLLAAGSLVLLWQQAGPGREFIAVSAMLGAILGLTLTIRLRNRRLIRRMLPKKENG